MAENSAIARPYAEAAFELANEAGQLVAWSDAIGAAAAVVSDDQVAALIGAPSTDSDKLVQLIAGVAGQAAAAVPAAQLANLIRLLAENGRLMTLPDISVAFDALKAATENRVEVTLVAASPVDESQQAGIIEALKKRFGKDVSLTVEIDASLIGGARLQADDLVIDGTVSAGLSKLATAVAN